MEMTAATGKLNRNLKTDMYFCRISFKAGRTENYF